MGEIAQRDRPYCEWLLTTDFSEPVKAMLRGVLEGRLPAPPRGPEAPAVVRPPALEPA